MKAAVTPKDAESFAEFLKSFYYGQRSDLQFKFLADLSEGEGGLFFAELLDELGKAFDRDDYRPLKELVFEWQVHAWGQAPVRPRYDDQPFSRLEGPLPDTSVAVVTAGGVHRHGDPTAESQADATKHLRSYIANPPALATIPRDAG